MDSSVVKWSGLQRLRLSSALWRGIPPEQRWGSILDGLVKAEDQTKNKHQGQQNGQKDLAVAQFVGHQLSAIGALSPRSTQWSRLQS